MLGYPDDLLLRDHSLQALEQSITCTVRYLESLGWIINTETSALRPAQNLKYLGPILDTVQARVFLPPVRICAREGSGALDTGHQTTLHLALYESSRKDGVLLRGSALCPVPFQTHTTWLGTEEDKPWIIQCSYLLGHA